MYSVYLIFGPHPPLWSIVPLTLASPLLAAPTVLAKSRLSARTRNKNCGCRVGGTGSSGAIGNRSSNIRWESLGCPDRAVPGAPPPSANAPVPAQSAPRALAGHVPAAPLGSVGGLCPSPWSLGWYTDLPHIPPRGSSARARALDTLGGHVGRRVGSGF